MNKNKNFLIFSILVLISIGTLIFFVLMQNAIPQKHSFSGDNYTFNVQYTGNNKWSYDLKVNKPSPCDLLNMNRGKSAEDMYTISITITDDPLADCEQKIDEYTETGVIEGSETLQFDINVNNTATFSEDGNTKRITKDGYTLLANYSESKWEYQITGFKPTPCHIVKSDALVRESFPEQVSIELTITDATNKDIVCSQVLTEFKEIGEFQASENATIDLVIK